MYVYIYYGRIYCTQNLIWEINETLGYLLKIIYDIIIFADTVYSKKTYMLIYIYIFFWGHEIIYYIWVWSPPCVSITYRCDGKHLRSIRKAMRGLIPTMVVTIVSTSVHVHVCPCILQLHMRCDEGI